LLFLPFNPLQDLVQFFSGVKTLHQSLTVQV
jgi:hypothetical protein